MTRGATAWLALASAACGDTYVLSPAQAATSATGSGGGGAVDAGPDAPPDADGGGGAGGRADGGTDCLDNDVHDGRACVAKGWFLLARWTTARWTTSNAYPPYGQQLQQPVYLDAFWIDEHEVTQAAYGGFVKTTGAPPLPSECGYETFDNPGGLNPPATFQNEVSGWVGNEPAPAYGPTPVICVTRAEATAFCAAKGGRLPTVAEWMKAGRAHDDDDRRFPWGDEPPGDGGAESLQDLAAHMIVGKAGDPSQPGLRLAPVGSDGLGRSPRNLLGLAGNASELLSTCAEDLLVAYPPDRELVRPADPPKETCSDAVLVGGTNWRSAFNQHAGSQTVHRFFYDGAHYAMGTDTSPQWAADGTWYFSWPIDGLAGTDPAGNDRRSWQVGFRCVYPFE